MTVEELSHAKSLVLEWLQNSPTPLSIPELLGRPDEEEQIRPLALRHAIWNLLDQGVLEFTKDRCVKLSQELN